MATSLCIAESCCYVLLLPLCRFGGLGCKPCPAGKYSTGGNYTACKTCGLNQSSPPQSPGVEFCECAAGYGLTVSEPSVKSAQWAHSGQDHPSMLLMLGKAGQQLQLKQAARRRVPAPCLYCDVVSMGSRFTTLQQGATSVYECVCKPGYGGKQCNISRPGTCSPGGTLADCIALWRCGHD